MRLIYFFVFVCFGFNGQMTPGIDPHWSLKIQDDFNGTAIDPNKWTVQDNFDHYAYFLAQPSSDYYISAFQVWLADNVTVQSGFCRLKTIKRATPYVCPYPYVSQYWCSAQNNIPDLSQYYVSSGWISSADSTEWQYGYMECDIKMEYDPHTYNAFWTFRADDDLYPSGCEIDIFELFGKQKYYDESTEPISKFTSRLETNYHVQPPNDGLAIIHRLNSIGLDWTNWNRYAVEWNQNIIRYYVNGSFIREIINDSILCKNETRIQNGLYKTAWEIDKPDNWQGKPPGFSKNMDLDNYKVYKLNFQCGVAYNTNLHNPSAYTHSVKKSITIGDGANLGTFVPNSTSFLRATDFILFDKNTEILPGMVVSAEVTPCE